MSEDFGIVGMILLLVACGFVMGSCHGSPDSDETIFKAANCSTVPTGRAHPNAKAVKSEDGKSLGATEGNASYEWITICERSEWK